MELFPTLLTSAVPPQTLTGLHPWWNTLVPWWNSVAGLGIYRTEPLQKDNYWDCEASLYLLQSKSFLGLFMSSLLLQLLRHAGPLTDVLICQLFPVVPLPLDSVVSLSGAAFPIPVVVLPSTSQLCIALWPPGMNNSVLLILYLCSK